MIDLTLVFCEPPAKTRGDLYTWDDYWRILRYWLIKGFTEWMVDDLAFADDGVRMVER